MFKTVPSLQASGLQNATSFLFHFSHRIPSPVLSQPIHGERKACLAVTQRLLWAASTQPPGLVHFLAQHGTTRCDNLMPPSQAPNPPRRERPCHQAHTTRRRADQASSSFSHIGLLGQPYLDMSPKSGVRQPLDPTLPSSATRVHADKGALLEDISREKGVCGCQQRRRG